MRTAVDATGTERTNGRFDNDRARVVFAMEGGGAGTLELPAGAHEID